MFGKLRILCMVVVACLITFFTSITAYAEEKSVAVNISKEYHNCTIWISAVEGDTWNVTIVSPTEEVYKCIYSEADSAYYCEFSRLVAGSWNVVINSENTIPQTQITVKASKQNDSMGNVTIAKGVAGLQIYVVDNKAVVEWTDTTVGNLCIKVFDTDTFKVLADVKTDDMYYECEFSDTVDKVTVSVVPAQSQNVEGAEHSVTLKANYEPKGSVTFSDITITNQLTYTFNLYLQQTYSVLAEVNGTVKDLGTFNAGSHDVIIDIKEGNNDIKIYLKEDNGSRKSFSTSVVCDLIKPTMTLNKEYNGIVTNSNSIIVEGRVTDFDTLTINGVVQNVLNDGTFSSQCGLFSGVNKIEIIAKDKAGNETVYVANVTQGEVKKGASTLANIITLVLYAVIIVLAIKVVPKLLKKKEQTEEEEADVDEEVDTDEEYEEREETDGQ